jgi:hypothetical protein
MRMQCRSLHKKLTLKCFKRSSGLSMKLKARSSRAPERGLKYSQLLKEAIIAANSH